MLGLPVRIVRAPVLMSHPPGTKFDHLGLLSKPFTMTKDGYVMINKKRQGQRGLGAVAGLVGIDCPLMK